MLLVHHKESEEWFVASVHGMRRCGLMFNDFVIVSPASDPARVRTRGADLPSPKRSRFGFAQAGLPHRRPGAFSAKGVVARPL